MELLDQLEAENPEDPALAPKVRRGRGSGTRVLARGAVACMSRSTHSLTSAHDPLSSTGRNGIRLLPEVKRAAKRTGAWHAHTCHRVAEAARNPAPRLHKQTPCATPTPLLSPRRLAPLPRPTSPGPIGVGVHLHQVPADYAKAGDGVRPNGAPAEAPGASAAVDLAVPCWPCCDSRGFTGDQKAERAGLGRPERVLTMAWPWVGVTAGGQAWHGSCSGGGGRASMHD